MDQAASVIEKADESGKFKGIYLNLQKLKDGSTSDTRKDVALYTNLMIVFRPHGEERQRHERGAQRRREGTTRN